MDSIFLLLCLCFSNDPICHTACNSNHVMRGPISDSKGGHGAEEISDQIITTNQLPMYIQRILGILSDFICFNTPYWLNIPFYSVGNPVAREPVPGFTRDVCWSHLHGFRTPAVYASTVGYKISHYRLCKDTVPFKISSSESPCLQKGNCCTECP